MSKPRIESYKGPAAGWGALKAVGTHLSHSGAPLANVRALLKLNQPDGFDCPGCAWGDPEHGSSFEFCENGVKAVSWETTSKRVDDAFFERYTVSEMKRWDDYRLEDQGRLTRPMRFDRASDRYVPIEWSDALDLIADHLRALDDPDQALFYTSGKACNESAYTFQLLARLYGTNNLPDCSNMCHEASGVGLGEALGVGKGSVLLDDFERAEAIFSFGQNPGTNHPRMLGTLREAHERGCEVVAINTLKERGLERFADPQRKFEMLRGGSEAVSSMYLCPKLGGDMAIVRGMAKVVFERDALDHDFIARYTQGVDAYRAVVEATAWETIEAQSGLSRAEITRAAEIYIRSNATIICWAMGITQHEHSVASVREIVNLLLLRGNIGKPGAGTCPVRGHSNVQGDRTMGVNEKAPEWFFQALERYYGVSLKRGHGHDTVSAIRAMREGACRVFIGLAGNFARATSDSNVCEAALSSCNLTVHMSTKLNRSHLVTGRDALILPVIGRVETDAKADGTPQLITVEDSMSMVHGSAGIQRPASPMLRSEVAVICGIGERLLGSQVVDWMALAEDYDRIRDQIAEVIPGFSDFNRRVREPRGFWLGNPGARREFSTASGFAEFSSDPLPEAVLHQRLARETGWLTLQTLRSHDQYNTTVYGYDDRYRGVKGMRRVIFLNPNDIERLGLKDGQWVDLVGREEDGVPRRAEAFRIVSYDTPEGCAAAYYPETNPLIPLDSVGIKSNTPNSKSVAVRLAPSARLA
ncbi:FdhF/YdeP family oxidoreductase [Halotalea alkalilenta]|uniref:CbbBc protein n=1 Tax=Halotalea alkalilenta TaxID=376489 RepID=A0A172YBZ2_9GAMM|nr:FdhF/YdeP family oxidoreductase [Halotalea alkalilenta]ANF56525.1 CbbBc protein [Halotalea alkalilenta]